MRTHYYWGYETEDPNLLHFNAVMVSEIHESPDGYLKHIEIDKKSNTKETTEYRGVPNQKKLGASSRIWPLGLHSKIRQVNMAFDR